LGAAPIRADKREISRRDPMGAPPGYLVSWSELS
jgi:hypothetical protein